MDTSSCSVKAGNRATGYGDSKEENQNYLSDFNYGSIVKGVITSMRGSSADESAFGESLSANSKDSTSVAFVETKLNRQDLEMAPNWNKSPLLFNSRIEVSSAQFRSPTLLVKKVWKPAITPMSQKLPVKELSPSSDHDILRLDCSEDELALIEKLSEGDDDILNISKEEENELLKSEDEEELVKIRHYLLESRGKRNLVCDEQQVPVKNVEDDLLRLSDEEELLSDVDTDLEDRLLNSDEDVGKIKDIFFNNGVEVRRTSAAVGVEESSKPVEVVNENIEGRFMIHDEECLPKDTDSEPSEVVEVLDDVTKAKLVSEVEAFEGELSEDEETVRFTDDGNMVFSEHSDEDDTDFQEDEIEEVVEDDELEIVFVKDKEGSAVKLSTGIVNKPLTNALGGELPVHLSDVENMSAEKKIKMEQLARSHSSAALSQCLEQVLSNTGEVSEDSEVQFIGENDLKLAIGSHSDDDLFSDGGQSSKPSMGNPVDQQLVEVEGAAVKAHSVGVDRTEKSYSQLIEHSDRNECREFASLNEGCTNKIQDVGTVDVLSVDVPISQHFEEVLGPQHIDEVPGIQEVNIVPVPLPREEVPTSQLVKEVPVTLHLTETTIPQNDEEVSVPQNVQVSVPQDVKEVLVPPNIEEVSVFENVKKSSFTQNVDISVSQNVEEIPVSETVEVPASQNGEVPVSQRHYVVGSRRLAVVDSQTKDVPISQLLEQAVSQRIEVLSSRQEENVVPRLGTRTGSQGSRPISQGTEDLALKRVEGARASQVVEEVSTLQGAVERVSQRADNLFTRRDVHSRQSLNDSSAATGHQQSPLLSNRLQTRSLLPSPQSSTTSSKYDATYLDQNVPSHQGPIVSNRWGNQPSSYNFSGGFGANIDFSSDISTDFTWDYQRCAPSHWNHISNVPSDSSPKFYPNASSAMGFYSGQVVDSSINFGGAQTTPAFLADETSTEPGSFTSYNSRPCNHFKEDEIQDNNDPRWEEIRGLTTDAERYASLQKRWGNATMPDPRKNLTTHNYLLKNRARNPQLAARTPIFTNGRKRRASSSLVGERPGKRLCSILDEKFADVERQTNQHIERLQGQCLFQIKQVEQQREAAIADFVNAYGYEFLNGDYFNDLECMTYRRKNEINNYFGREIDGVMKRKAKATGELKSAVDEMEAFYKFYGDDSNVHLTPEEVEIFVEQERMFSLYDKFYDG